MTNLFPGIIGECFIVNILLTLLILLVIPVILLLVIIVTDILTPLKPDRPAIFSNNNWNKRGCSSPSWSHETTRRKIEIQYRYAGLKTDVQT